MTITQEMVKKTSNELKEHTGKEWSNSHTYIRLWRMQNRQSQSKIYKSRNKDLDAILLDNLGLQGV